MSEERLSALIADIYDAALDPELWLDVLEKSSKFVGGSCASLCSKDSVNKTCNVNYVVGAEARYIQSYEEKYVKLDPTAPGFFFFDVGEIISVADILPVAEFFETRFYREWVQPQGWVDLETSVLEKSGTSYSVFSVFWHERDGLADEGARDRMRLIVPHIRRATLIGKTIQLNKAEAATLADMLDSFAAGVFVVEAAGRLIQANISGHAILADASVLRAVGGRLTASDPAADEALRDAFAGADGGDAGIGTQGIAVPLPAENGDLYVAHILPLTSGARREAGARYAATAAVFVRRTQLELPAAPEVIAKLYKLTPSELRVLLAVFESTSVSAIADALGISKPTAKTHLRRLFEKTGTQRQSDLIKLVAGFASPDR